MAFIVPNFDDPFRNVVKVVTTFPSGAQAEGTGVAVDHNSVLTASHLVFAAEEGGAAMQVEVIPGLYRTNIGPVAPYGSALAQEWIYYEVDVDGDGLLDAAESATDIALLSFERDLGVPGIAYGPPPPPPFSARIAGYFAETGDGTSLWIDDSGSVRDNGDGTLDISNFRDVEAGSSGGPVWVGTFDVGIGITVIGLVSTGGAAVSLGSDAFLALADRIASDDVLIAERPVSDLAIHRFYNTRTATHFYTASEAERDYVQRSFPQFQYEGNRYDATSDAGAGVDVFRFYNVLTQAHFYTASAAERDQVLATLPQFRFEGIAYHAWDSDEGHVSLHALHRFYNDRTATHFYTDSGAEVDFVLRSFPQFRYEGVAYYVDDPI